MRLIHFFLLSALPPLTAAAAGTPKLGQPLHDKQCVACHAQKFGGDGSKMYTRADHRIHTLQALRQRVAACSAQTNAGWFPEDEENVAAWLNQQYYKFK
ncbi:MAG: cytochrome c [Betaproteobacteria bacterium]|nr:cytochrome c [Betaproteobacteria bacterium]